VAAEVATAPVGGTTQVEIVLFAAKGGLSGFDIVVTVQDPAIAEMVGSELPNFGLTEVVEDSEGGLRLRAVDLNGLVPVGADRALLATLEVQGTAVGSTAIAIMVRAMDDEAEQPLEPLVEAGLLEVE